MSFVPSAGSRSCLMSCEIPTFAITNAFGAVSRTTEYVGTSIGSRSAARWLPTPIAIPRFSATRARSSLTASARPWPPVIPEITSGSASVRPRKVVRRSTSSASTSGSASWTIWTSSQPAGVRVSTSASAASFRCSPLRRAMSSASLIGAPSVEHPFRRQRTVLGLVEPTKSAPYLVVVLAESRAGVFQSRRRVREDERRGHGPDRFQNGMGRLTEEAPLLELGIGRDFGNGLHRGDAEPAVAQRGNDLLARALAGPPRDQPVEIRIVARPFRVSGCLAEALPLLVAPHAERDPAVVTGAGVHPVRARDRIAVAVSRGHAAVRRELEQCRRHEFQTRLVLRQIDRAALTCAPAALESGEDRDHAVADGDVVNVRAIQDHGRAPELAEKLVEAGKRREVAAVARML